MAMKEPFRQIIKEYFTFSKKDRNGLLVLSFIIIVLLVVNFIAGKIETKPSARFLKIVEELKEYEKTGGEVLSDKVFFTFDPNTVSAEELDSFAMPSNIKRNMLNYRQAGGIFRKPEDIQKIYGMNDSIFSEIKGYVYILENTEKTEEKDKPKAETREILYKAFNPNSVTKEELLNMGFNIYQAGNLIKYRENGGKFINTEDLLKIYGIDSTLYFSVKKFIELPDGSISGNSVETQNKIAKIEINKADSSELVQLYGIGPVFASRILKYRNLLGGFYYKQQLTEVYGFNNDLYNQIRDMIETDTLLVKKIRINFAEYSELIRHPYIEKEHANAILNYRQKNGPFKNIEQLPVHGLTDTATFRRLRPYITCR